MIIRAASVISTRSCDLYDNYCYFHDNIEVIFIDKLLINSFTLDFRERDTKSLLRYFSIFIYAFIDICTQDTIDDALVFIFINILLTIANLL